jgi:hypothetical protein
LATSTSASSHERQLVVEHVVDDAVAVAPDLGHTDRDHADDQSAQRQRDRQRPVQAAETAARALEQRQVRRRAMSEQHAQQAVQRQLPGRAEIDVRHLVHRPVAQKVARGRIRDHRGDDQRAETLHRNRPEHHFGDEQRAGDRRVVGCGHTGRRAAGDQQAQPGHRRLGPLADLRGHGRGHLHQRAFAADRAPDPMLKNEDAACSIAAPLLSWPLPTATASM